MSARPVLRLVSKPASVPPASLPFDDWRLHIGSNHWDRLFIHLDWSLCQKEFFICASCTGLQEQAGRVGRMYDICWNCYCREWGAPWVRSWLEQFWVQIVGAA